MEAKKYGSMGGGLPYIYTDTAAGSEVSENAELGQAFLASHVLLGPQFPKLLIFTCGLP